MQKNILETHQSIKTSHLVQITCNIQFSRVGKDHVTSLLTHFKILSIPSPEINISHEAYIEMGTSTSETCLCKYWSLRQG